MALLFECMGKCCRNMLDTADLFSTTPVVQSATLIGGGHVATISANVNTNGILWVINGTNMQAYGAGTLKLLYTTIRPRTRAREIPCQPLRTSPLRPSLMERCMSRPGRTWWSTDYSRPY